MKEPLRIGIVGCGGIARAHLQAYQAVGDVDIVSVFDVNSQAAESFAADANARAAASIQAMVQDDNLDAVSVCTPPGVHVENCQPFVRARIPVLCEKPFAADARQAARLVALVRQHRSLFMVAFCHRFHPAIIELKKLIATGDLGKPLLFRNIFSSAVPIKGNHRANPALSGGGCLIDNGSHSIDLFRYLVGEPTSVHAFIGNVAQKLPIEDINVLTVEMKGKALGEITSSYSIAIGANWVEWHGTKGTAVINYWNDGYNNTPLPDLAYRVAGDTAWRSVDCSAHPDRFAGEIAHFLNCVRNRKKPLITVDDGMASIRVVQAAYKSAKSGRRVAL